MIRSFGDKKPRIAESAFISEAAYIIGDVEIGEDSGVFPGAVIRGDFSSIKIGRRTMIVDNCVVHSGEPLEIGDNNTIGHCVVIHGTRIGNHCLIGNHATILDNSVIGNNCVIGAGCLITPGIQVPDNSLVVGIPGVIKEIPEEMKKRRQGGGGKAYAELLKLYKQYPELKS
jgi:carbonic anhydrase/acetyltransferase-like protein (isoleucine patch superfamily)